MIRSMTGYGAATRPLDDVTVTVEVRSVNSRGLKIVIKGPPAAEAWEPELRAIVADGVRRGRVDLLLRFEPTGGASARVLDDDRVREVLDACQRLRSEFGVAGETDLATLLQIPGLFREGSDASAAVPPFEAVEATARAALSGLIEMRGGEGERLELDLRGRIAAIRAAVREAERRAPARLARERDRLQAAVSELAGRELDEERLAREIALIADRWNVSEELVRASAHLDAFEEYLDRPSEEPVGKRLGFLVQELQREINTLGAKANDPDISRLVVEAKNEIEKLREQVENVE